MSDETKEQETLSLEEITSIDVDRRSLITGGKLLVTAGAVGSLTGCLSGLVLSDTCNTDYGDPSIADYDPYDPVRYDFDVGDPCDSD